MKTRGCRIVACGSRESCDGLSRPGPIDRAARRAERGADRVVVRLRLAEQHDETHGSASEKCGAAHAGELRHRERAASKLRAAQLELASQGRGERGQRLRLDFARKISGDHEAIGCDDESSRDVLQLHELREQRAKVASERRARGNGGAHASSERQLPHTRSRWETAVAAVTSRSNAKVSRATSSVRRYVVSAAPSITAWRSGPNPARASTAVAMRASFTARAATASVRGPRGSAKTRVASGRMNSTSRLSVGRCRRSAGVAPFAAGACVAAGVVAVVTAGVLAGVAIGIAAGTTTGVAAGLGAALGARSRGTSSRARASGKSG